MHAQNYIPYDDLYEYFDRWCESREIVLGDDYDARFEKWLECDAHEYGIGYEYTTDRYFI